MSWFKPSQPCRHSLIGTSLQKDGEKKIQVSSRERGDREGSLTNYGHKQKRLDLRKQNQFHLTTSPIVFKQDSKKLNRMNDRGLWSVKESSWKHVASSVPQGSVLNPVLSSTINDQDVIDQWLECHFSEFAHDIKLGRMADTPEGCTAIQQELDRERYRQSRTSWRSEKTKLDSCTWGDKNSCTSTG